MQLGVLQAQLARVERDIRRAENRFGSGTSHTTTLTDGDEMRFTIKGVPPREELDDHIRHALVSLWSLKDYLVHEVSLSQSISTKEAQKIVHHAVNNSLPLRFCADLANRIKHRELTISQTGRFPRLEESGTYSLRLERDPRTGRLIGTGVEQITRSIGAVEVVATNQGDSQWVDYRVRVLDKDDRIAGEACKIIKKSYDAWAEFLTKNKLTWPSSAP